MQGVIEVADLSKTYANGIKANDGVSFVIRKGEAVGLLGPNGSGKTTLLRQIYGELRSNRGSIRVFGKEIPDELTGVKNRLGVMPQEARPRTDLTVYSHIYYSQLLRGFGKAEARSLTDRIVEALGLQENRETYVLDLSGGTQRKVFLAMCLAHSPELLLLDEPTVGLDIQFRNKMWEVLKSATVDRGETMLLTTHYPQDIEMLCSRVICLDKGRVRYDGAVTSLLAQTHTSSLEQAFLSLLETP